MVVELGGHLLHGGAVVKALDVWLTGHGFNSQPVRIHVT